MNEDQRELIEKLVTEGEYLWPGRLSSALACTPGLWFNEPLRWRELIDELLAAGTLRQGKVGADPIRFAVSGEPLGLEVSGSANPPSAENPEKPPTLECRGCEFTTEEPVMMEQHALPAHQQVVQAGLCSCGTQIDAGRELCAGCATNVAARVQPEPPVRKKRRTAEEVAAAKAAKDAEREMTKLHREALAMDKVRERDLAKAAAKLAREAAAAQAKIDKALAKAQLKEATYLAGIREAEGELVELPAVVVRMPSGPPRVTSVTDVQAWKVMEMYLDALCVDVEHAGYPLGHAKYEIRTIQLGGEQAAIVFDAQDPRQMEIAALALSLASKLHAHSAIADIIPCVVHGLIGWDEAWAKMHDSVLYAKLIDPKMSGSDANELKALAHDLLREYAVSPEAEKAKNTLFKAMGCLIETTLQTPDDKNGWNCVNRFSETMIRYAGSDVLDLAAVMRVFPPLPVEESVLDREREFEAICARVGLDGFALDHQHIIEKITAEEEEKATAQHRVMVLSDGRIPNPKSVDVIKVLPEVLPGIELPMHRKTGKPSADKSSLEKLARTDDALTHHLCKQILDYRHHDTTLGLLLNPLRLLCEYGDGRMRPTVYTIEADTGRTSCRRPNGQQFSRQGGVRACVHADPGFLGVDADFQGCEIRVGAALSGDQALYDAEVSPRCYKCDRDAFMEDPCSCGVKDGELAAHTGLHWLAAHEAFGHDATKEHRYWCKRGIFTRLFGGKPATAADQVYCDVSSMDRVFDAFKEIAPVYTAWDQWLRDCFYEGSMVWRDYATGQNYSQKIEGSKTGIYRTYSGRNIYVTAPHAFGNYAIQGTARELLVDGCLKWNRGPWRQHALLPIHDEVFTWVPAEQAQDALRYLVECMQTEVLSSPGFEIKIGADPSAPFLAWPDSS